MSLEGQTVLKDVEQTGALALSDVINAHVGVNPKLLQKADGDRHLVLVATKGDWTIRIGDHVAAGMPAAAVPAAEVTDGSAGFPLPEGRSLVLPAPANLTVAGYAADSALTYYFI